MGFSQAAQFGFGVKPVAYRCVADDAPVSHDNIAFRKSGNIQLVSNHDDGDSLVVEFLKYAHDLDAGLAVEIAGRFICKEERRLVHQGACDGHTLLLAARELVRMMVGAVGEADKLQRTQCPFMLLTSREMSVQIEHRQLHIFECRGSGEQVESLENEADLLVADIGERVTVQL